MMRRIDRKNRDKGKHKSDKALTLVEMVMALAMMGIVFTAIVPLFRQIRDGWDSKEGAAETLQNGRILTDHLYRNLSKAVRITAVSSSSELNGYIEFEDNDKENLRYDVNSTTNYVEYGSIGAISDLAGPVSHLQFLCYDPCDLDTPTMDPNSIRLVKVYTTLTNAALLGQDKTLIVSAYLRTNALGGDEGGIWTELDSGISFTLWSLCFPVDAITGYVAGNHGTILKTTDGGETWVVQSSGLPSTPVYSMCFPINATTGYAVGGSGAIIKTTDGGASWISQNSGTSKSLQSVYFPVDTTIGYAVGDSGTILKTTDGGAVWTSQDSGTNRSLYSVFFPFDTSTGYAVGGSGVILKTIDGGTTWTSQDSGTNQSLYSMHFPADATTGYAVGGGGVVTKTINGGITWTLQNSGTIEPLYSVHFPVDETTGYAVGQNGVLTTTNNGGSTWIVQDSGTANPLRMVCFPVDTVTGFAVGDDGTILKTTNAGAEGGQILP